MVHFVNYVRSDWPESWQPRFLVHARPCQSVSVAHAGFALDLIRPSRKQNGRGMVEKLPQLQRCRTTSTSNMQA
jgi:hypothetical protein